MKYNFTIVKRENGVFSALTVREGSHDLAHFEGPMSMYAAGAFIAALEGAYSGDCMRVAKDHWK